MNNNSTFISTDSFESACLEPNYHHSSTLGTSSPSARDLQSHTLTVTAPAEIEDQSERQSMTEEKPRRPLTAYNLFFRMERDRLLNEIPEYTITREHVAKISARRRYATGEKRQHRKTHGKIGFNELTSMISNRWKNIDKETLDLFEKRAAEEKRNYLAAVKKWNQRQAVMKKNGKMQSAVKRVTQLTSSEAPVATPASDSNHTAALLHDVWTPHDIEDTFDIDLAADASFAMINDTHAPIHPAPTLNGRKMMPGYGSWGWDMPNHMHQQNFNAISFDAEMMMTMRDDEFQMMQYQQEQAMMMMMMMQKQRRQTPMMQPLRRRVSMQGMPAPERRSSTSSLSLSGPPQIRRRASMPGMLPSQGVQLQHRHISGTNVPKTLSHARMVMPVSNALANQQQQQKQKQMKRMLTNQMAMINSMDGSRPQSMMMRMNRFAGCKMPPPAGYSKMPMKGNFPPSRKNKRRHFMMETSSIVTKTASEAAISTDDVFNICDQAENIVESIEASFADDLHHTEVNSNVVENNATPENYGKIGDSHRDNHYDIHNDQDDGEYDIGYCFDDIFDDI